MNHLDSTIEFLSRADLKPEDDAMLGFVISICQDETSHQYFVYNEAMSYLDVFMQGITRKETYLNRGNGFKTAMGRRMNSLMTKLVARQTEVRIAKWRQHTSV